MCNHKGPTTSKGIKESVYSAESELAARNHHGRDGGPAVLCRLVHLTERNVLIEITNNI